MKKWIGVILTLAVAGILIGLVIIPAIAQGGEPNTDIPSSISYQGYLTDDQGDPIDSPVDITFTLYTELNGGTPVWSEKHTGVQPGNGLFSLELGENGSPMSTAVFEGDRYLGVKVGTDDEMDQRQMLSSVAYAFVADYANTANTLDGLDSKDILKQDIHDFVVASGESVTAGDVVSFLNGEVKKGFSGGNTIVYGNEKDINQNVQDISAASLSSTRFVVFFENANSRYSRAAIGDVSGATITFGSSYTCSSGTGNHFVSVAALSSDKFVVSYGAGKHSKYGTAVIGDVSGTTITFGSEYVFNADVTEDTSVAALSSDKFVVSYWDGGNSDYGTAIIGDVSGTTITFGSEYVFNAAGSRGISVAALSSTKFVVSYQDIGNSYYGTAIIGDVSGTTITYGSENVFNANNTLSNTSVAALSPSKFVVSYRDIVTTNVTLIIGDVSDTTITYGSEYVFNACRYRSTSVAALSPTKFVVSYGDNEGMALIGDVSGTTITRGAQYVFNSPGSRSASVAALSPTKFVVSYGDGNYPIGTAIIGDIILDGYLIVGIAQESKTGGETVPVTMGGISDIHSGLTVGEHYYCDLYGNLTTSPTSRGIGIAISTSELLLDIEESIWD